MASIVHVLPFQYSASVRPVPGLLLLWYSPVAAQLVAEWQETPFSRASTESAGLGVASTVHVLPFQYSASVRGAPELVVYQPTVVQLLAGCMKRRSGRW